MVLGKDILTNSLDAAISSQRTALCAMFEHTQMFSFACVSQARRMTGEYLLGLFMPVMCVYCYHMFQSSLVFSFSLPLSVFFRAIILSAF